MDRIHQVVTTKNTAGMPASMTFSNESTMSFWVVSSSTKDGRADNADDEDDEDDEDDDDDDDDDDDE